MQYEEVASYLFENTISMKSSTVLLGGILHYYLLSPIAMY